MQTFLDILRKFGLIIAVAIFSLGLQAAIFYIPISILLERQETVSGWLEEGQAYENFAPLIASQMSKPPKPGEERLAVAQADLERIINESLPVDVLQGYGDGLVAGFYGWLKGETPKPVFRVDLNERRPQIEASFKNLIVERLTGKPVCSPVPSIQDYDPLTANCLLPRRTPQNTADVFASKLFSEEGGLGELVLDSEEVYAGQDLSGHPLVKLYSLLNPLRIILIVTVLVSAALAVILSQSWRAGLKRISWIALTVAIFASVGTLIITRLLPSAIGRSVVEAGREDVNIAGLIIPVVNVALADIGRAILWVAVPLMIASIVVLVWLWQSGKRTPARTGNSKLKNFKN